MGKSYLTPPPKPWFGKGWNHIWLGPLTIGGSFSFIWTGDGILHGRYPDSYKRVTVYYRWWHIHPASRGVAAHTACLFWSVRGAKGGFPPWGLPKLGNFHFSPPWGLLKLGNFHFSPPWGLPKLGNFYFSPPWGLPKLGNFHFPPRGGFPS